MEEIDIEGLASYLKEAKNEKQPNPIFFLGAGASFSGGIPLAKGIVKIIQEKYAENHKVLKLNKDNESLEISKEDTNYTELMNCLTPSQRNKLLDELINKAKINVTHIYLAQLIKEGFVDYVLTVNFDNLMLRALALFDIFPPVYDLTTMGSFTTSKPKEKSVLYLHGRHQGVWLLNTQSEMDKVKEIVPKIFSEIQGRPWIFLGYSGSDPIFEHIQKLGRFDHNMYWVGYDDKLPIEKVEDLLGQSNVGAHFIRGYDADAFMLKLNNELGLTQPDILEKPFSILKKMLANIVDINDEDHFRGVKERLGIAKDNTETAISIFENKEVISIDQRKLIINDHKKEIIRMIISKDFEESKILRVRSLVEKTNDKDTNDLLSQLYLHAGNKNIELIKNPELSSQEVESLYHQAIEKYKQALAINPNDFLALFTWGVVLDGLAKEKSGKEAESLYRQAIEKYKQALIVKPDSFNALNNWGIILNNLAKEKSGKEAESLYRQAIEKYKQALIVKPDNFNALNNWGTALNGLARMTFGEEAESLYCQAIEKYKQALIVKPDNYETLDNWAMALTALAGMTSGKEAESLYHQAFEKCEQALAIKPGRCETFHNWGFSLSELAREKSGKEAESLYHQAFEKYEKALAIKPNDFNAFNNWGLGLSELAMMKPRKEAESLYRQAIEKYEQALTVKPDNFKALNNWGTALNGLARMTFGEEAESLYCQAIEKYEQVLAINPNLYEVLINWGYTLVRLAREKSGKEAESLYHQAFEKYEQVLTINPNLHVVLINWRDALSNLAGMKLGKEAESLYHQAFKKYEQALAVNSYRHEKNNEY